MNGHNDNNSKSYNRKSRDEALVEYHLDVYSRARQLQAMRSGLLSNEDAIRIATFEHFSKGLIAMTMSLRHANLFGGESKEDQIKAMMDYAIAAASDSSNSNNSSSELAVSIMAELFDRLRSKNNTKQELQQCEKPMAAAADLHNEREPEECCAP